MPKKILVIDDEEIIIKSLSRLLEKNVYEVFIAKNGQDAIIMAEEGDFDLILADIRMPGISGVEAIESIYGNIKTANTKKPPVIFITGYADDEIAEHAKSVNPIAYIYKPFDMPELVDKIKEVLG